MYEAEAADLVALKGGLDIRLEKVNLRGAEHADLGVCVAQVRNLDDLGDAFEARPAARAEEAIGRIYGVTAVAVEVGPVVQFREERNVDSVSGTVTEVEVTAALLRRRQRVIEVAHRIGRRHDLQLEVGELLHLRGRRHIGASDQSLESDDEVVERKVGIERVNAEESVSAVAAPVHCA